jgi:mannan endo-1,4-beta-mannosidase
MFGVVCSFVVTLDLRSLQGQYNEDAWQAFDFVISEASKRGLRLVIALANNWDSADTSIEHRDWANTDNKYASFHRAVRTGPIIIKNVIGLV